jgi:tetratricopeptide (TPR) repeat protein
MYSQLLKEVLLKLEYSDQAQKELVDFCRQQYANNNRELAIINEFEETYEQSLSIWWYTRECFVYSMLNKALRTQDIEVIMRMGYFIHDLHRQIEELHSQSDNLHSFTVYRGQGVSANEFEKLSKSKGCLLSFNNFLSTSTMTDVSLRYVRRAQINPDLIGILFRMKIDPSISSTPFASLDNISYYSNGEKEILFSMHTVFRVGDMEQLEDRLWRVDLTLTNESDQQLAHLTEYIRQEIDGKTGLHRIGALMIKMGQFDKAEEIYSLLLEKISDNNPEELAVLHHQLGYINDEKGDLRAGQCHYDFSIRMALTYLPSDHPRLSTTYSDLGVILKKQGHLDAALKRFELALHLDLQVLAPDQLKIAIRHNDIGLVLKDQGRYADALKSYKRALEIFLNRLPPRHPELARIYNNIGLVYDSMDDKLTALSYYEKTLDIEQKSLPSDHSTLAITHHHIATVLTDLHRYEEAIEHAKQAVDIAHHTFDSNHIQMQIYQNYLEQLLSKV